MDDFLWAVEHACGILKLKMLIKNCMNKNCIYILQACKCLSDQYCARKVVYLVKH